MYISPIASTRQVFIHRKKGFLSIVFLLFLGLIFIIGLAAFFIFGKDTIPFKKTSNSNRAAVKIGIIQYFDTLDPAVVGFKDGLGELGYTEGDKVVFDYQNANGNIDKPQVFAKELIKKDVDLIYTVTAVSTIGALKEASSSGSQIPIVFAHADNPIKAGIVKSLRSSGNNTTGVAVSLSDITAKKLEFLALIKPGAKKIGILVAKHTDTAGTLALAELRLQASKFGYTLIEYPIENPLGPASATEIENKLSTIKPGEIDAYFHLPGPIINFPGRTNMFIEFGKRLKIPTIFIINSQVEEGGLLSFAYDPYVIGKQAAVMAVKVLNGTKPADIPIEVPDKTLLSINLRTARESGIVIPDALLNIADKKIE